MFQKYFYTRLICLLSLLLIISIQADAQVRQRRQKRIAAENMPKYDRRLFHFGINLGMNLNWLAIRPIADLRSLSPDTIYSVNYLIQPGFTMGIESNLRLSNHFDLRFTPSLTLGTKSIVYQRPKGVVNQLDIESTLLEFPLYIKFKSVRLTNWRAYVIGGGKYTYDLSNKIKAEDASEYPVKLRPHDVTAELGFGMDFYLPYFKFSTQVKASFGFLDLKHPENNIFNNAIDRMNSRSVFIQFLFE
ncbi:MAG: PorT family protein [Flavobacteriales bacterium]|nr:PorT family protein [Flavobacteriales bacterium]